MGMDAGIMLPSEVWAPTMCADEYPKCSMFDFAPLLEPGRNHCAWISSYFCWGPPYDLAGMPHCDGCEISQAWANKWIHPVKTSLWAAVDCCTVVNGNVSDRWK